MKISLADVAPDLRKGFGLALEPNGDLMAWSGKPPEGAVDVVTTLIEVVRTDLEWRAAVAAETLDRSAWAGCAGVSVEDFALADRLEAACRSTDAAARAHEAALAKVTL